MVIVTFEITKIYREDIHAKLGRQDVTDLGPISTDKLDCSTWPARALFYSLLLAHSKYSPDMWQAPRKCLLNPEGWKSRSCLSGIASPTGKVSDV